MTGYRAWRLVVEYLHTHITRNKRKAGRRCDLQTTLQSYWSQSQIFVENPDCSLPHLHSTPPLEGFPSEYRHPVWYVKTRMVWVGEKMLMIFLFVLAQLTNVTDRQTRTDTAWRHRLRLSIASHGNKMTAIAGRQYVVYWLLAIAVIFFYWIAMKVVQQLTGLTLSRPSGPAYSTGELLNTPLMSRANMSCDNISDFRAGFQWNK